MVFLLCLVGLPHSWTGERMGEVKDFWSEYEGFRWDKISDVEKFVADAIQHETYINGFLQFDYGSDWVENWWRPVRGAVKSMISDFSPEDLLKGIEILLEPMDSDAGDCAIMDSLIRGEVDFSVPRLQRYMENYYENWCEDSYVSWPWDNVQFSYCAYESIALSPASSPEMLNRIFKDSFVMQESHIVFRIRVALAKNSSTPQEILNFLFENRSKPDWLISDTDSYIGGESPLKDDLRIDEEYETLASIRADTQSLIDESLPNEATYMYSIMNIDWDPGSATEALLCAFAQNASLSQQMYSALYETGLESVIYYLSKNGSIKGDLNEILKSLKPTFTLTYAGGRFQDTIT